MGEVVKAPATEPTRNGKLVTDLRSKCTGNRRYVERDIPSVGKMRFQTLTYHEASKIPEWYDDDDLLAAYMAWTIVDEDGQQLEEFEKDGDGVIIPSSFQHLKRLEAPVAAAIMAVIQEHCLDIPDHAELKGN